MNTNNNAPISKESENALALMGTIVISAIGLLSWWQGDIRLALQCLQTIGMGAVGFGLWRIFGPK